MIELREGKVLGGRSGRLTSFTSDEGLRTRGIPHTKPDEDHSGCELLLGVASDIRGYHCERHTEAEVLHVA